MHYYDFALCSALAEQGVDVTLFTCDETSVPQGLSFPVELTFQGVFGEAPAWRRGLRYAQALTRIARYRPRDVPSIVHVHFFHALPLDYAFLAWMHARGCRILLTAHDVIPFDTGGWGMSPVRRIYHLTDGVIVHNQSSRAALLEQGIVPQERIAVIPHGHYLPYVDQIPPMAEARRKLDLPLDAPVILFFGQIKKVKGLDVLLQALPLLADRYRGIRLVIAGKVWKDDWSRYATLIDELGIKGRLDLHLCHIPDDQVAGYFAAADVVALPYRHVYQSGVLLMALSYARPVVATRVGGMPEVIQDGETGYLVFPGDPEGLAEAIGRGLDDPQAAQAMGQRGRALVQERYSWTRIGALTKQVYERVLTR
jgi:glycosyltransferase involved in cell wall biosynthesis